MDRLADAQIGRAAEFVIAASILSSVGRGFSEERR
jgi:hypothetical protein